MRQDNNLPPAAQPWARQLTADVDELLADQNTLSETSISELRDQVARQNGVIQDLMYRITTLYTLTGQTYPPAPPAPPAPPNPAPVPVTIQIVADWSRTWGSSSFYTGGGTDTNATYLYQGSSPENKIGIFHFNVGSAAGKTITAVDMFIANINSPYAPTFTASFGTHGFASAPAGKPGRSNGFDYGWARGQAAWIPVPSWAYSGLSNGSIQGFTVGGSGASNSNYAYFQGVGQPAPPQLRITYNS